MMRDTILIADDSIHNRLVLRMIFEKDYDILEVEDGIEALSRISDPKNKIGIVLLDLIMPKMDGIQVLRKMSKNGVITKTPVILITGSEDIRLEKESYELGVSDIIKKPFDSYIVKRRVENVLELYKHKNDLEMLVDIQTKKIGEQNRKIREANDFLIDALSTAVEFRDSGSGMHIKRIKSFTYLMLCAMQKQYPQYGITDSQIYKITSASAMHDIGKIAISDNILLKPSKLTPEEFEIMKTHTTKGCKMLEKLDRIEDKEFYHYCYDICHSHHERADGKGYPLGLKDDEIPLAAKVVSIADVYDALTSERVYKEAYSHEKAIEMIMRGECGSFSKDLLVCLCKIQDELKNCQQRFSNIEDI